MFNSKITFQTKGNTHEQGQPIEAAQKKLGKDTTKVAADVNAVIDCITKAVKKEPVQIIGFGTFSVVKPLLARESIPKPEKRSKSKLPNVQAQAQGIYLICLIYTLKNPATTGFFRPYEKRGSQRHLLNTPRLLFELPPVESSFLEITWITMAVRFWEWR